MDLTLFLTSPADRYSCILEERLYDLSIVVGLLQLLIYIQGPLFDIMFHSRLTSQTTQICE